MAAVWSALTRPALWPKWGPSLTSASGPPTIGPGSHGTVTPVLGPKLTWTVDAFARDRFWSWRVGGIAATGHAVAPARSTGTGEPRTEVVFDAPWWALFYLPVLHLGLRRLADFVEDETPTGSAGGVRGTLGE